MRGAVSVALAFTVPTRNLFLVLPYVVVLFGIEPDHRTPGGGCGGSYEKSPTLRSCILPTPSLQTVHLPAGHPC